jgi:2-oxo-4-hydroxy-4-carboxy-5-ureidoimidazoline decarboxylase
MMQATDSELRAGLEAALSVRRWVIEVSGIAPFESVDELLQVASRAATPLRPSEIDEALAHHPRIGETASGDGAAAAHSRREQGAIAADSDADADAEALSAALAAGNAAYEARFERVFLIRAAGRTRAEILDELTRRLALDHEAELEIVGQQLREIAMLRLAATFGSKEDSL